MALPRLTACLVSLGALSLGGPADAASSPPADIAGYYRLPESDLPPAPPVPVIVEIYGCGDAQFCGRIAGHGWLPETDSYNPRPESRARLLCGLEILTLRRSADRLRGKFYDPRSGDDTVIDLRISKTGDLQVTGHSGQPILSRAYVRGMAVWQRVTPPQPGCGQPRPSS